MMVRHDDFPTNRELLDEYNQQARDLMVLTYMRQMSRVLPAMLVDKPLAMVNLHFRQYYEDPLHEVGTEHVALRLHSVGEAEDLAETLGYRDLSPERLAHYVAASEAAKDIKLSDGADLSLIQPEAVHAEYTLTYHNGKRRRVGSFKEKPAKASIVAGKLCMEEAQAYVAARFDFELDRVQAPADDQRVRMIMGAFGLTQTMRHWYELAMTPELPLNGYESPVFLERYRQQMFEIAMRESERVERQQQYDVAHPLIELHTERHLQALAAFQRADHLLGRTS